LVSSPSCSFSEKQEAEQQQKGTKQREEASITHQRTGEEEVGGGLGWLSTAQRPSLFFTVTAPCKIHATFYIFLYINYRAFLYLAHLLQVQNKLGSFYFFPLFVKNILEKKMFWGAIGDRLFGYFQRSTKIHQRS
jgi:hypothetical protein